MPRLLAANDIIKIRLWTHDAEQAAVNTFHYLVTAITGAGPVSEVDFATAFDNAVSIAYRALISSSARYDGVQVQVVFPLPLLVAEAYVGGAGNGTANVAGAARQSAPLIGWKSGVAGPGGRGRTYIPFTPADATDGAGNATAAYKALLQAFATAVRTFTTVVVGGATLTCGLVIKKSNAATTIGVSSDVVSGKIATQKRRGTFGRPNTSPI